jgi:hypothetical protein
MDTGCPALHPIAEYIDLQMAFFSTDGVCRATPLVLDLDGDGVRLSSLEDGVPFDLLGIGEPVTCAWPTGEDALLVLDANGNGLVDDGTELFGSIAFGETQVHGFVPLRRLDSNGDERLDRADPAFDRLGLWVDGDRDGKSDATELYGLLERGIVALDLAASRVDPPWSYDEHGNSLALASAFVWAGGARGSLVDAYLRFQP